MGNIAKLNACLNLLGGIRLHTFTDRKVLQKRIYLLQEFGVDLGYHFGWYIYGPYSSELASDAFFLLQQKMQAPSTIESYTLSPDDSKAIQRFKKLLEEENLIKNMAESGYWLELFASLHFLWKFSFFKEKKTREAISKKLNEQKISMFKDEDIATAWKLLEAFGLVSFA